MSCQHCVGIEQFFDTQQAQKDLRGYRSEGPMKAAQMLLQALEQAGVDGSASAGHRRWRRCVAA
jgi:hypothetical protein